MPILIFDFSKTRINQAGDWNGLLLTFKDGSATRTRIADFDATGLVPSTSNSSGPLLALPDDSEPPEILCEMAAGFMGCNIGALKPNEPIREGKTFTISFTRKKQSFFG